jgi:hypothetical protein
MNIGLVDIDSHGGFPNLALMKIAAFHKAQGDSVEHANPLFGHYDRVYMSKIFTFTPDYLYSFDCEVVKGGTGYNMFTSLPDEIETMQPDYTIYPNCDFSIQFFSRGCIRQCPFCIVRKKEGYIHSVEPMQLNASCKTLSGQKSINNH